MKVTVVLAMTMVSMAILSGICAADDAAAQVTVQASALCNDSDGGQNLYATGVTTGLNGQKMDACVNLRGDYSPDLLREYYCTADGYAGFVEYECPFGCENGSCLSRPITTWNLEGTATITFENSGALPASTVAQLPAVVTLNGCTESTGDSDYQSRGTVTDRTGVTKTDYCIIGGKKEEMRKYYCQFDGYLASTEVECMDKCLDGACTNGGAEPLQPRDYLANR